MPRKKDATGATPDLFDSGSPRAGGARDDGLNVIASEATQSIFARAPKVLDRHAACAARDDAGESLA